MAYCAYAVDLAYGKRHGDDALSTLERVLKLPLARRLRPFFGARLSLLVALGCAALVMWLRRSPRLGLQTTIRYLFSAATALAGSAAVCIDAKAAHRYAAVLAPFAALGEEHPAAFVHEYVQYLAVRSEDRVAQTAGVAKALIAKLESSRVRGIPKRLSDSFLSGALFSLGVTEAWRDDPRVLCTADRLHHFTAFYRMAADHLRAAWHTGQGNAAEAARYRQIVEMHAIELGSAWQVETWAPADLLKTALLTHDALSIKRAAQELSRIAEDIPSLSNHARTARAGYLLLRDKPAKALPLLEQEDEPQAILGWTRGRGLLAHAYNGLGDHERARSTCLDALRRLDPDDLDYPSMNLNVQVELALAEAGLGNFDVARTQLDALLSRHGPNKGPLTLGSLHDAYIRVALQAADFGTCAEHLRQLEAWYRPTAIPSLLERLDVLRRRVARAKRTGGNEASEVQLLNDDVHLITRVQLILTQTGTMLAERASKGLQIAVELSGADDGFIVLQGTSGQAPVTCLNEAPRDELVTWAHRRLMAAYANDETAAVEHVESLIDLNLHVVDGVGYCVAPLWARRDNQDVVVAALALGFRKSTPRLPGADVLRVIAGHLVDSAKPSATDPHAR